MNKDEPSIIDLWLAKRSKLPMVVTVPASSIKKLMIDIAGIFLVALIIGFMVAPWFASLIEAKIALMRGKEAWEAEKSISVRVVLWAVCLISWGFLIMNRHYMT
jgi:hypothetical protein